MLYITVRSLYFRLFRVIMSFKSFKLSKNASFISCSYEGLFIRYVYTWCAYYFQKICKLFILFTILSELTSHLYIFQMVFLKCLLRVFSKLKSFLTLFIFALSCWSCSLWNLFPNKNLGVTQTSETLSESFISKNAADKNYQYNKKNETNHKYNYDYFVLIKQHLLI